MLDQNILLSIKKLAKQKNAIILSHYYQDSEIQDLADFVGDSLELSNIAASTEADIIVFCGVYFMAEVAKVLNPKKLVLVPDVNAGCSLADSCQIDGFSKFRKSYPNHVSVTYINSSLEVKAASDIICTSANAEFILREVSGGKPILFAPDKYLGGYLQKKTGIEMVMWPGTCIVHESFSEKAIISILAKIGDEAKVIAHPECPEVLLNYADFIGSTSQLINYTAEHNGSKFVVLTEEGVLHKMRKVSPNSQFFSPQSSDGSCGFCAKCSYMRLNSLEKIYSCLLNETNQINIDADLMESARGSIDRMMELSKKLKKR